MTAIDQAVRERAITALTTSIALSAGAGSGKTSVLTQRVVGLLASGVAPARIAAVTFTEKASGELQERVRDALEARLEAGPDPVLERALAALPELTLSTIHSFCQQLITAEALDAAWAPDTEILPSALASEEVAAAFTNWEALFRSEDVTVGLIVRRVVGVPALRKAAVTLLGFRDLAPVVDPFTFDPARAARGLAEAHARLEAVAAECTNPAGDKLLAGNASLRSMLADAIARPPEQALVRTLGSAEVGKTSGGRKGDWPGDSKARFIEAVRCYQDWRARQLGALHGRVVSHLHAHFLPAALAAKARAAVADFDDLLFRAAALLDGPGARARLAARYDAVLIDEVQDTDPIQAEVAALLTRAPAAEGPWSAHPPRPGGLFAVGDPRQSIYRFRRADVATWAELEGLIGQAGETLALKQNFRSVPGLVSWVNAAFSDLPGYVAQVPYRGAAALEPVVRLPLGDDEDEVSPVARYLIHLGETGQVIDRESGQLRPMRWSDVMVLLPTWTRSEAVRDTLERAGVPCLVEGGGAFFDRDEVTASVAALRCIDEPGDARSTLAALRGLFGIDWPTLARHRAAGGTWRCTVPDPPPGPVAEAFALLRDLSRVRGRRPWAVVLDAVLERSRAAAVWSALRDGPARLANLDKLRALLRELEGAARSPSAVIAALGELDKEKDLSRVDLDNDAVRVTSYFKAKGLEAPVVVLCHARRNRSSVEAVVDRQARQVAVKVGALVPSTWPQLVEREQVDAEAERRRWMYVAATRARDHLVFTDDPKGLVATHLPAGFASAPSVDLATLPPLSLASETFPGLDAEVDEWLADPPAPPPSATEAWQAARTAAVRSARAGCTAWRSVHEVATQERVTEASSAVGVAGGALVHDVMEGLDLGRPLEALLLELPARVDGSAAALGVAPALAETCLGVLRELLGSPIIARARHAPERWVEVPFSITDNGRVVSGRIDLAFPTDASRRRWVVVDWKSDLPARDTPAWRNYQRQLALYAKALLQTVSPCESVESVLVGPHPALGPGPSVIEAVGQVAPALVPGVEALLADGGPTPLVGVALAGVAVALAWPDRRVALCLAPSATEVAAVRAAGWTVIEAEPTELAWSDRTMAAVRAALGF